MDGGCWVVIYFLFDQAWKRGGRTADGCEIASSSSQVAMRNQALFRLLEVLSGPAWAGRKEIGLGPKSGVTMMMRL